MIGVMKVWWEVRVDGVDTALKSFFVIPAVHGANIFQTFVTIFFIRTLGEVFSSEMEVAPRYIMLTLLTLFILFILFKLLNTA